MNTKTVFLAALLAVSLAGCDRNTDTVSPEQSDTSSTPAQQASTDKPAAVGDQRPGFVMTDIDGQQRNINEWDNKVLVINFWATWCPPCRKETPAFVELQSQYGDQGLQFIGVAIDEKDNVIDFADTYGVNYPMLIGNLDAINISKAYGNRFGSLPYTVIVDRTGKINYITRGELLKSTAENKIKDLL